MIAKIGVKDEQREPTRSFNDSRNPGGHQIKSCVCYGKKAKNRGILEQVRTTRLYRTIRRAPAKQAAPNRLVRMLRFKLWCPVALGACRAVLVGITGVIGTVSLNSGMAGNFTLDLVQSSLADLFQEPAGVKYQRTGIVMSCAGGV